MNTILALTKTTIKMFIRSRQALFFSLFLPLMLMFTFGVIGFDKALTFDVGLVSENPQPATKNFVNQIKNFSIFNIHSGSLDDELKELKDALANTETSPEDLKTKHEALAEEIQKIGASMYQQPSAGAPADGASETSTDDPDVKVYEKEKKEDDKSEDTN